MAQDTDMVENDDIDVAWDALDDIHFEEVDSSTLLHTGGLEPLSPGDVITVRGELHSTCERFAVNLVCAGDKGQVGEESDRALHLNPRVSQRYVVRNHCAGGRWGTEETAAPVPFPLRRDQPFTIDIFVAEDCFFIQINRVHFCQFSFRLPLGRVSGVEVRGGGLVLEGVQRGHAPSYPMGRAAPPRVGLVSNQNKLWENPVTAVLEEGMRSGRQLVVEGRVRLLPHSFYLNLQSSVHLYPHPDIALHINPRFVRTSKHVVVWNSWQNGSWGNEERSESSQFTPGAPFQLRIQCADGHFCVWERNNMIGIFHFRIHPQCVRAVHLAGDVLLHDLYLSDAPPCSLPQEEDR